MTGDWQLIVGEPIEESVEKPERKLEGVIVSSTNPMKRSLSPEGIETMETMEINKTRPFKRRRARYQRLPPNQRLVISDDAKEACLKIFLIFMLTSVLYLFVIWPII